VQKKRGGTRITDRLRKGEEFEVDDQNGGKGQGKGAED